MSNIEAPCIEEPMRNRQERLVTELALAQIKRAWCTTQEQGWGVSFAGWLVIFFSQTFQLWTTNSASARGSGAHFWKSPFKRSLWAHFLQVRVRHFFACCRVALHLPCCRVCLKHYFILFRKNAKQHSFCFEKMPSNHFILFRKNASFCFEKMPSNHFIFRNPFCKRRFR